MTDEIPLLEVKDLQKYYEDGYHAVRGVSYKIGSGLLVGLIGPNGCGKTTMMKCINRLHDPTSGNIFIDGESVLNKSPGEVAKIVANVPAELRTSFRSDGLRDRNAGKIPLSQERVVGNERG